MYNLEAFEIAASKAHTQSKVRAYALTLAIDIMYVSGCRPADVLAISNWFIEGNDTVKFIPRKGNELRTIYSPDLVQLVTTAKELFPFFGTQLTYVRLYRFLKPFVPQSLNVYDRKHVITYMFRYAYIQRKLDLGHNIEDLKYDLGHKNLLSTISYFTKLN